MRSRLAFMEAGQRLLLKPSKKHRTSLQGLRGYLIRVRRREAGVDEISAGLYEEWPRSVPEAK